MLQVIRDLVNDDADEKDTRMHTLTFDSSATFSSCDDVSSLALFSLFSSPIMLASSSSAAKTANAIRREHFNFTAGSFVRDSGKKSVRRKYSVDKA